MLVSYELDSDKKTDVACQFIMEKQSNSRLVVS